MERIIFQIACGAIIALLVVTRFVIVPANLQMGVLTASILFIGAHKSLKFNEIDSVTGKRANEGDAITKRDALMFPFFGSAVLLSLYVCYKYIGKEYLNVLLTTYIMLAGVAAVANTIEPFFKPVLPKSWLPKSHLIHFNIPKLLQRLTDGQTEFRLHFSKADVITHLVGLSLAVLFLKTKDFTIHNLFGIAFSIQAIKLISLGQFVNAFIMLWGLFVYDVFWVFGTDVMLTVALSFEAPAKIIFPQSFEPWKQGILGLGDIVIPGIFVALCLRFDDYINCQKKQIDHRRENIDIFAKFPRVYFYTVMLGYIGGLVATAVAMHLMKAAQPALLYLVPGTTVPVFIVALARGHLKIMLSFTEDDSKADDRVVPTEAETKKIK